MEVVEEKKKSRGHRKERVGTVVSDRQNKTISVDVERLTAHPLYKKTVSRKKRYTVHDENNEAKVGDKVQIIETKPLSKMKRWRLLKILSKAN